MNIFRSLSFSTIVFILGIYVGHSSSYKWYNINQPSTFGEKVDVISTDVYEWSDRTITKYKDKFFD